MRKNKRKPRDTWINLDFGAPVALNQMTLDPETGRVRVFHDGEERFPHSAKVVLGYNRTKGFKKTITIPTSPQELIPHPNRALEHFDLILAVDTNYRVIREILVGVTAVVAARKSAVHIPNKTSLKCSILDAFEIRGQRSSPERIGWMEILSRFTSGPSYDSSGQTALVVDSDLDQQLAINNRLSPVYDEYYLPKAITIVYASSDTANDSISNQLIKIADSISNSLLARISRDPDETNLRSVNSKPFSHIRVWEPPTA